MRKLAFIILVALANLGQAPALKGGTVTGSITAVQKGKPIASNDVWVYLEGPTTPRPSLGKDVTANIVQYKKQFDPRFVVVPIGANVFFPNRDGEKHNVFSPAVKANDWFGFDLGSYGTDKKGRNRNFNSLGEFDIYCDMHLQMWAKVKVVPSRYYTRVVDGKFTFVDVAPGTYTLVAWAPDSRESRSSQAFEVKVGETKQTESLNVQVVTATRHHTRLDGTEYEPYPDKN